MTDNYESCLDMIEVISDIVVFSFKTRFSRKRGLLLNHLTIDGRELDYSETDLLIQRELCKLIGHGSFRDFNLNENEAKALAVITRFWAYTGVSWKELCIYLQLDTKNPSSCLSLVNSLIAKKILSSNIYQPNRNPNQNDTNFGILRLRRSIYTTALDIDVSALLDKTLKEVWRCNPDMTKDVFSFFNILFSCYSDRVQFTPYSHSKEAVEPRFIEQHLLKFYQKLQKEDKELVLISLISENRFSQQEVLTLLLATYFTMFRSYGLDKLSLGQLLYMQGFNYNDKYATEKFVQSHEKLLKSGILKMLQYADGKPKHQNDALSLTDFVILDEKVVQKIRWQ